MFRNATPFAAVDVPILDRVGHELVVVIVKATFRVMDGSHVVLAEEQSGVRLADELRDDTNAQSSARYPSDLCTEKLGTDVVVLGDAVARKPIMAMDVAIQVKSAMMPMRVHGVREYYRGVIEVAVSAPVPFERMPIIWEKAYGGATADGSLVELRNPSGLGLAKEPKALIGTRAPQIELPTVPHKTSKDHHAPVGCGPILPHWSPRRDFAGTFDEVWRATRMPLMPKDFDIRHNNVAPPPLLFAPALIAGDAISILGMTLPELFAFRVPPMPVVLSARYDDRVLEVRPAIDTILIEPTLARFEMVLRGAFVVGRGRSSLREIRANIDE